MSSRRKTRAGPQVGQLVMVRRHGARGMDDVAWGTVVGGGPGRPQVKIEGSFPDPITGKKLYNEDEVLEFKRIDGFSVVPTRRPIIR